MQVPGVPVMDNPGTLCASPLCYVGVVEMGISRCTEHEVVGEG